MDEDTIRRDETSQEDGVQHERDSTNPQPPADQRRPPNSSPSGEDVKGRDWRERDTNRRAHGPDDLKA